MSKSVVSVVISVVLPLADRVFARNRLSWLSCRAPAVQVSLSPIPPRIDFFVL